MSRLATWLESNMMTCQFKEGVGMECPGCGIQRAAVDLLNGDFAASIEHYPALMPMLLLLAVAAAHIKFKFRYGQVALLALFLVCVGLIIGNWVLNLFAQVGS